jgi:hypothetical protein
MNLELFYMIDTIVFRLTFSFTGFNVTTLI